MTRSGYAIRAFIKRYSFWWETGLTTTYVLCVITALIALVLWIASLQHKNG